MVSVEGVKPTTYALEGRYSIQLSYTDILDAGDSNALSDIKFMRLMRHFFSIPAISLAISLSKDNSHSEPRGGC